MEVTVTKLIRESYKTHTKIVFHEREVSPRNKFEPSRNINFMGAGHHHENMFNLHEI